MMFKSSIILVLFVVAASCHFEDEFQAIGSYERPDKTAKTWYLSKGSSKWSDAVEECKEYGMKLANFGSDKEEAVALLNIYRSSSNHPDAFIGYTNENQEGTFTTFEGEILKIEINFHKNQPNNFRGVQHCLELYNKNNVVKYNDVDCNVKRQFICELESLIIIGSYERPDKTSKTWYLSTGNSTWSEAVEECKEYGMNLATFGSDKEEAIALLNIYRSSSNNADAFIGYTDKEHEGTFTTFEGEILQIEINFHKNEPNNYRGVEHCLEFYNKNNVVKYNDQSCNVKRQFICELENKCQSCDRVNKDNIRLQNALNEAQLYQQRKDELFNVLKSKYEEILKLMQNILEVEKSSHKKCSDELKSLKRHCSIESSSF